jgi:hypothetical protein
MEAKPWRNVCGVTSSRPAFATARSNFAAEWLDALDLRPRTIDGYRYRLERHLLPRFARRKLTDLTVDDVARLVAEMKRGAYAGWTIQSVLTTLSAMLRKAERRPSLPGSRRRATFLRIAGTDACSTAAPSSTSGCGEESDADPLRSCNPASTLN